MPAVDTDLRYSTLTHAIEHAPATWIPGLLITVVRCALRQRIFQSKHALLVLVRNTMDQA